HQRRTQQTRPAIAAARVGAVTELAIHAVQSSAALDRRRISGRPHRVILTALPRRGPATTTATTTRGRLSVSRGSDQYQQRTARRRAHPSARVVGSAFNVGRHTGPLLISFQLSALGSRLSAIGSRLSGEQ